MARCGIDESEIDAEMAFVLGLHAVKNLANLIYNQSKCGGEYAKRSISNRNKKNSIYAEFAR
jgi:hypothetical protein